MKFFQGKRYITRGILAELNPAITNQIWQLLDDFVLKQREVPDYFQIFYIKKDENDECLEISHIQESPEYYGSYSYQFPQCEGIDEKVYVISDLDEFGNEYHTMLLASEY